MALNYEDQQRANAYREAIGEAYNSMIRNWADLWGQAQHTLGRWLDARGEAGNDQLYQVLLDWVGHVMLREYLAQIEKQSHSPAQSNLRLMTSEDFWEMFVRNCAPMEIHNSYDYLYEVISLTVLNGLRVE